MRMATWTGHSFRQLCGGRRQRRKTELIVFFFFFAMFRSMVNCLDGLDKA